MSTPELEKRKYLFRAVQMNPVEQSDEIISRREKLLGLNTHKHRAGQADSQDIAAMRAKSRARIEDLRAQFWTMPAARLRSQLDAIPVKQFTDLKISVDRLKTLSLYRDDCQRLAKHPQCDINLLNNFKRAVILSPREAGKVKERYLRSLATNPKANEIKKMVLMLKKEFPNLYNTESDWFNEIARLKSRKVHDDSEVDYDAGVGFEIPGWLIWLIVVVVAQFLLYAFRMR